MNGLTLRVVDVPLAAHTYHVVPFQGGLPELQAAVGGLVEPIPTDEAVTMWVHDEGKFVPLPVNRLAMDVWLRWDVHGCMLLGGDWIAGNCVVTGGVDAYGNSLDIPTPHVRGCCGWPVTRVRRWCCERQVLPVRPCVPEATPPGRRGAGVPVGRQR